MLALPAGELLGFMATFQSPLKTHLISFSFSKIFTSIGASRCWIKPSPLKCFNKEYFIANEAECTHFHRISGYNSTHKSCLISTWIFENGICVLSIFLTASLFAVGCIIEMKNRHNNKSLQGKRKFLEVARKRKARLFLTRVLTNFLSLFLCFGIYHLARYSIQIFGNNRAGFIFLLFGTILNTLFGLFHVLIFLNVKLHRDEALTRETSNYSIRKSVRSKESFNLVTGGYVPKKKVIPPKGDFGGIYLGDDDDEVGDEDYDDFDIAQFEKQSLLTMVICYQNCSDIP